MRARILHEPPILTRYGFLGVVPLPGFYKIPFSGKKGIIFYNNEDKRVSLRVQTNLLSLKAVSLCTLDSSGVVIGSKFMALAQKEAHRGERE